MRLSGNPGSFTTSRLGYWCGGTACLLGASIPLSTLLMNLALVSVMLCLLCARPLAWRWSLWRRPLIWLPALMLLMMVVSLWHQDNDAGGLIVKKYLKLLYILPLASFFLQQRLLAGLFLRGFLWANGLVLAISLAGGLRWLASWQMDAANPIVFKLHITQNFFMSLSALFWLSLACGHTGRRRVAYGLLVLLAVYNVLFQVWGRTGYLALLAGAAVWVCLALGRWRGGLLAALAALALLLPNRATDRMLLGVGEIHQCLRAIRQGDSAGCDSSMGLRARFTAQSLRMIGDAPLVGHGAGSFCSGKTQSGYYFNAHNEFLMQATQSGLIGLGIYLAWLYQGFHAAWRLAPLARNSVMAVLSSYLVGNLFNSFLLDSAESLFFIALTAILAGCPPALRQFYGETSNTPRCRWWR
ncbi:O-antigen ligase family protein [Acerihabitans arboris]|uniref:O-antigen ligase family protein n=1 Tax=Acerihabitans arboris TaxID=2691583 RepID=A0A845SN91_9GAMM|nr:O-antigen ligase family protein [Acerihabitans arboris]NDL64071.1 O-antigen ligase family protein [Acerihabitans arboris]